MILDGAGQVSARNNIGYYGNSGWTQETPPGHVAIAAGSNGLQMVLDGVGQVWARNSFIGGWTQQTGPGQVAIAAGANGQMMLLDGVGQVWAKNTLNASVGWTQETGPGETAIAMGDNGLQMILDERAKYGLEQHRIWGLDAGNGTWNNQFPLVTAACR
jgi:hypothetical protein